MKSDAARNGGASNTGTGYLPFTLELPKYAEGFDELYFVKIEGDSFVIEGWEEDDEIR